MLEDKSLRYIYIYIYKRFVWICGCVPKKEVPRACYSRLTISQKLLNKLITTLTIEKKNVS